MTFTPFLKYLERGNSMVAIEAIGRSQISPLGDPEAPDRLSHSFDNELPQGEILFDRQLFFVKGGKPKGGGGSKPAELPLTLFPLSTVDPKALTLTALKRHEKLKKQERGQAWKDFWASSDPPMDNTTKEGD